MPKISVVMPTYNAEKYLREAIDSILNQTYGDFEFLIIDDNSTDATREIIKSYNDSRIRLIDGPCKGIAAALNKGLDEAKGEYIARMDADDISLPERFFEQVAFMDANPDVGICGTKATKFYPDGREEDWGDIKQYPNLLDMLFECLFCHPTVMFRSKDLNKYNLRYDSTLYCAEDQDLWFKAINCTKFQNIMRPLLMYRKSDQNASTFHKEKGENHVKFLRKEILHKFYPTIALDDKNYNENLKELKRLSKNGKIKESFKYLSGHFVNTIPIFMSSSREMFPSACVTITSILKNTKSYIKFCILSRKGVISDKEKSKLRSLQQRFRNFEYKVYEIDESLFKGFKLPDSNYITLETYFRYLIPGIDVAIDKALYLDSDLVVTDEIEGLYNINLGENYIGAVKNVKGFYFSSFLAKVIAKCGIKDVNSYFNAGVLSLNLKKMREDNITQKLFEVTAERISELELADQDVFNIVFEDTNLEINPAYNSHPTKITQAYIPKIIHYVGKAKPWMEKNVGYEVFWKYAKISPYYNYLKKLAYRNGVMKLTDSMHNIFSIKNEGFYKVIRLIGIKIRFKNAKRLLKIVHQQENEINKLKKLVSEQNREIAKLKQVDISSISGGS